MPKCIMDAEDVFRRTVIMNLTYTYPLRQSLCKNARKVITIKEKANYSLWRVRVADNSLYTNLVKAVDIDCIGKPFNLKCNVCLRPLSTLVSILFKWVIISANFGTDPLFLFAFLFLQLWWGFRERRLPLNRIAFLIIKY